MKLYDIVFSPTGGTQKAATLLTDGLEGEVTRVSLTESKQDFSVIQLMQEDVAVICVPSYGGRVPAVAVKRLTALHGNGARAVLVCVYGNRAYEDTLVELEDAAKQAGFRVIAAVAAVADHSVARQFAAGRPDVCRAEGGIPGRRTGADSGWAVSENCSRKCPYFPGYEGGAPEAKETGEIPSCGTGWV